MNTVVEPAATDPAEPSGAPRLLERAHLAPWMGPWAAYLALVTVITWLYGLWPGHSLPFGSVALIGGWAHCVDHASHTCTQVGFPAGIPMSLGSSVIVFVWAASHLGVGAEVAMNVLALVCIAAGAAALWLTVRSFVPSHVAGFMAALLFYVSPAVAAHAGLVSLYYGFAWLPVPVCLAVLAVRAAHTNTMTDAPRRVAMLAVGVFVSALALVYSDPYPWVIASALVLPAGLCVGIAALWSRRWRSALLLVAVAVALVLPGLLYSARESNGDLATTSPLSFYRAMSVDVATMIVPTRLEEIGRVLHSPVEAWKHTEFYGDGSNLAFNYVGLGTLVIAALGVIAVARKDRRTALIVGGLAVGGLVCLALGLGPSLKVFSRASTRPIAPGGQYQYGDYLMPASDARAPLPWSFLYDIQPFASMRVPYRWHVGLRLMVAMFTGAVVGIQWRRRKFLLAAAVSVFLVLEATPVLLTDLRHRTEIAHDQLTRYRADMDASFKGRFRAGERVIFLPAANDYLAMDLAPTYDIDTYNTTFDKAVAAVRAAQPEPVVHAFEGAATGQLGRDDVCALFRSATVDAVVFDDFSLRWDSYAWPPAAKARAAQRALNAKVGVFDDPAFAADQRPLAVIVRARPGAGCAPAAPS